MENIHRPRAKYEIDAEYMEHYNRGSGYVSTIDGPVFISDWLKSEYKKNGITAVKTKTKLLNVVWIMRTSRGWYPIQPSEKCKPEDHGALNDHITSIEDSAGKVLWTRSAQ